MQCLKVGIQAFERSCHSNHDNNGSGQVTKKSCFRPGFVTRKSRVGEFVASSCQKEPEVWQETRSKLEAAVRSTAGPALSLIFHTTTFSVVSPRKHSIRVNARSKAWPVLTHSRSTNCFDGGRKAMTRESSSPMNAQARRHRGLGHPASSGMGAQVRR